MGKFMKFTSRTRYETLRFFLLGATVFIDNDDRRYFFVGRLCELERVPSGPLKADLLEGVLSDMQDEVSDSLYEAFINIICRPFRDVNNSRLSY